MSVGAVRNMYITGSIAGPARGGRAKIYGVAWDKSTNPALTRTDATGESQGG